MEKVSEKKTWVVIDIRLAQGDVASGLSRYVKSITASLVEELNLEKKQKSLKLLLIGDELPPDWVCELVSSYPDSVSHWQGGQPSRGIWRHFPLIWSTKILKRIRCFTKDSFIWLAPGNIDRPLFISRKPIVQNFIQVIHDAIPFSRVKGLSLWFRMHFCSVVQRTVRKLPVIITTTQHSAEGILKHTKQNSEKIIPIPLGIESIFGSKNLYSGKSLLDHRKLFLSSYTANNFESLIEDICSSYWFVGVGRSTRYKNWNFALQLSAQFIHNEKKSWFFRVGISQKELNEYAKRSYFKSLGNIVIFEELRLIAIPYVHDHDLYTLFRLSDALLHPSSAEGFGIPPLEAALSGLPVVYNSKTAVHDHFPQEKGISDFWIGIDNLNIDDWREALKSILIARIKPTAFYKGLIQADETRSYVLDKAKTSDFLWSETAKKLLEVLFEREKIHG